MIKEKECKKCKQILAIKNFCKSITTKDGYLNTCKKCVLENQNESVEKQREINKLLLEKAKKELNNGNM